MNTTIDLTPILQAVIMLIAALITYRLIPWIKTKTTQRQFELMHDIAYSAVIAAEQIFGNGEGQKKLEYAIAYANDKLASAGLEIDRGTIEETVRRLKASPLGPLNDVKFEFVDDEPTEEQEPAEEA